MFILIMLLLGLAFLLFLIAAFGGALPQVNLVWLALDGGESRPLSALYGELVLAFAGVAHPDRFFSGLVEAGVELVGSLALPDHAVYDDRTVAGIRRSFRSTGATCLVTTAKDAVKLERHRRQLGKIWVAQLELLLADPGVLEAEVERVFQETGKSQ